MLYYVKLRLEVYIFVFSPNARLFSFPADFILTPQNPNFPSLSLIASSIALTLASKAPPQLTFLHSLRIRNLNALAYLPEKYYLCIEMSGKGLISRMSDECLMKQETVFSFYTDCQAVMRKFTLAGKTVVHMTTIFFPYRNNAYTSCHFHKGISHYDLVIWALQLVC